MEEKASDFLEAYTVTNENGTKQINIVPAINELYSRLKTATNMIKEVNTAIGDICQWGDTIEKRLNTLEGNKKIIIPTELETKQIIGGLK